MINPIIRLKSLPKAVISGVVLMSLGTGALAGDLGVVGNSVNVLNGASAIASPAIGANGIVADITGVPTAAGGLNFPTFTYTFEKNTAFTAGTYTFSAGFIIDQDSSGRRLELSIPSISITVSAGGVLSGSVSSAQSVTVLGRSDDSSITAVSTVSNNLATFSGSSLSFNSANQLTKIIAQGGILADVTASLNAATHYRYAVLLKQTSGPDNIRFGINAATTLTPFPCNSGSAFILNSGALASTYSGAYALQGRVSFTGAGGGQEAAPTPYSGVTCATFSASTPVTPPPAGSPQAISNTLTAIVIPTTGPVTTETVTAIQNAVTTANTSAATLASDPATTTTQAISMLETLNTALGVVGSATTKGATVSPESVTNTLNSIGSLLDALATKSPTTAQVSSAQSVVVSTLSALINTIPATASADTSQALMAQVSAMLSKVSSLPGSGITASLAEGAKTISLTAAQRSADSIATRIKLPPDQANLLKTNMRLYFSRTVSTFDFSAFVASFGTALSVSRVRLTPLTVSTSSIMSHGSDAAIPPSNSAATLASFLNPADVVVGTSAGSITANQSLLDSIGVTGSTATYDSTSKSLRISSGGKTVPVYATAAGLVADIFPIGVTVLPDGSAVSISNGIALDLVPAPRDPTSFIAALEGSAITVNISDKGVVTLTTSTGQKFSGTFGFDNVVMSTLTTSPVTFTAPTGNPASTSFVYRARYSDGSVQNIQPMVNFPTFFDAVASVGFYVVTDRSSGVITQGGTNGVRLRPDYFVTALSASDLTFHTANKDSFGLAYRRTTDFNSDGRLDFEVISSTGKQILYVL